MGDQSEIDRMFVRGEQTATLAPLPKIMTTETAELVRAALLPHLRAGGLPVV